MSPNSSRLDKTAIVYFQNTSLINKNQATFLVALQIHIHLHINRQMLQERFLALILALLLFTNSVYTQESNYKKMAGFDYLEVLHGTESDRKDLPLLIAFHYSSGSPEKTTSDYTDIDVPVRILLVRGNYRKRDGYSYYPVNHYTMDSLQQIKTAHRTVDSIAAFLSAAATKFGAQPIVSGISQGGDIAFMLAIYHPELCKASLPFAAFVHSQTYQEILQEAKNNSPVYLYQGEDDPIIDINYTRNAVEILRTRLTLQLTSYPGLGHDISPKMKKDYSALLNNLLR
jgi:phospholipase/carboxylesterase